MVREAIILAGGLGTRLRDAVPDLPKCMAPVAGRPFIYHVITYLRMQGIRRFVFSLGYKAEVIETYLQNNFPALDYSLAIEPEPLGTGGAIQLAIHQCQDRNVLVANGDTLFKINADELNFLQISKHAECVVALKPMNGFDRYGSIEMNKDGRITMFREKSWQSRGLINGGIYLLNKDSFLGYEFESKFSFEKDYLEKYIGSAPIYGCIQDEYFIDIGIPEDYQRAGIELSGELLDLKKIDKSWTLLLDRDGVINNEILDEYVLNWSQFIFSTGVLKAISHLSGIFGKIIIVTNQRGVSKKLMTEEDLILIHTEMVREITAAGGRIDAIYYCTDINNKCFERKPNPGMAVRLKNDYPDVDFSKSVMVGNKPSDMSFGRACGAFTVFLTTTNPEQVYPHPDIDLLFKDLPDFVKAIQS